VIGCLLLFVTLSSGWISRSPISYAMIYLGVGILLSPYGVNLIQIRPGAEFLERVAELVVLISLFSCGLKMNRPLNTWAWQSTVRLIGLLMPLCIAAVAAIAHWGLGMNWAGAILLGAILAPTDPVLASEVQMTHPEDFDELRFGLTSEGGLNDALAFPFVYFGLRGLESDNWQSWLGEWVAIDLFWAIAAGLAVGAIVPWAVVWLDKQLQRFRPTDSLMEDFIALSIVFLTYALTEMVNGYGFLAVFVAGIVTHRSYHNPEKRNSQLEFTEMLEKLSEFGTVILLGSLLRFEPIAQFGGQGLLIAGLLLFIIRPLGAWLSTVGQSIHPIRRWLFGWFGVRGIGSLYYLFYALGGGLKDTLGEQIAWITLMTVALSIVIHGTSATPLMGWYDRHIQKRKQLAIKTEPDSPLG
jgi:sodium/hydrogen antiporter